MKNVVVGSLESSDCLIQLRTAQTLKIHIESVVYDAYHEQIEAVIKKLIEEHQLNVVEVYCQDKGALEYTIKARLTTAIERFKEGENES